MKDDLTIIQEQHCSNYDSRKLCSYDIEMISKPTKPLIHQAARFWLFKKGAGVITINGNDYEVKENSFAAILPWDTTEIVEVKIPFQIAKIVYSTELISNTSFYSKNLGSDMNSIISAIPNKPIIDLSDKEAEVIDNIFRIIREEVGIESIYQIKEEIDLSDTYVTNKIYELLIDFVRYQKKLDLKDKDGKEVYIDFRNNILKYIYSHISEGVSLSQLSIVFYMSESSISKYVLELTGMNFSDLVNEMRISKTIDLLTHTDLSLDDISGITGFSDASHLIKVFSNRVNLSPKQYRKIYQTKDHIFKQKDKSLGFELISYINDNYMRDLTIAELSDKYQVNFVQINASLMYLVEMNFDEFLHHLRINKACELLLDTSDSIVDIGTKLGYNNNKTFVRNFVRLKKMNPSDFRKNIHLQIGNESIPQE